MKPFVSVLLPCRNEAAFIDRCLDSILANDYPADRLEVLVADGMSTDGTRDILALRAARDPRIRMLDNPNRVTPVALNLAIAAAQGEMLVRFDAHATMPGDYLRRVVDLLESSNASNAGGVIRTTPRSHGPFSVPITLALSSAFGVGNSAFRTTSAGTAPHSADTVFAGAWKREIFTRLGGFNENLARGQDLEFNLRIRRAGGAILLDPSLVCDYFARADLRSFLAHNFSNGIWAILPFAHASVVPVRPRHLIPLVFVTSLALSIAFPVPYALAIPAAYAFVNLAASANIAVANRRPALLALLPLTFAALHLSYGFGSAWGCVKLVALKLKPKGPIEEHAARTEA